MKRYIEIGQFDPGACAVLVLSALCVGWEYERPWSTCTCEPRSGTSTTVRALSCPILSLAYDKRPGILCDVSPLSYCTKACLYSS